MKIAGKPGPADERECTYVLDPGLANSTLVEHQEPKPASARCPKLIKTIILSRVAREGVLASARLVGNPKLAIALSSCLIDPRVPLKSEFGLR